MSKIKQGALGRGLNALINPNNFHQNPSEENAFINYKDINENDGNGVNIISKVAVDLIEPNPFQPRMHFEPEALEELKKSILANGLIQPITIRRVSEGRYQLISGERRLRACIDIGYKDIPAYIIKVDSEEAMLAMALIENIQREKLNPIEVGLAYKRLMEECNLTQDQIAEKVGKDRTTIANSIRLLKLPQEVQQSLIKEEITSGHARAIINLPSSLMQLELLKKIKEGNLTVRNVELLVKKMLTGNDIKKVSFNVANKSNGNGSQNNAVKDVEDRLRRIFATKVQCRQKNDGTGEIVIEFYSNDELERLFELFDVIEKNYH
ncbi:MAG TPA: ParB/RepB/Spo0J family partition protein [Ignavibacteriaceae bacterium]|nr:ParB/RepB/Spo0J family partition protein [Ignavibacteriaceae bacterium]